MATNADAVKKPKGTVLGRSAATGRFVLAPATTKKGTVSVQRIEAAVQTALSKRK
jgi:hypothetical protein